MKGQWKSGVDRKTEDERGKGNGGSGMDWRRESRRIRECKNGGGSVME